MNNTLAANVFFDELHFEDNASLAPHQSKAAWNASTWLPTEPTHKLDADEWTKKVDFHKHYLSRGILRIGTLRMTQYRVKPGECAKKFEVWSKAL